MSKWNIALISALLFACYFAYNCWQDKKAAQKEVTELFGKIELLERKAVNDNQIIAKREQEKSQDAVTIKQLNEQIKNALKDNQCANELMPSNISDWMRNGKN